MGATIPASHKPSRRTLLAPARSFSRCSFRGPSARRAPPLRRHASRAQCSAHQCPTRVYVGCTWYFDVRCEPQHAHSAVLLLSRFVAARILHRRRSPSPCTDARAVVQPRHGHASTSARARILISASESSSDVATVCKGHLLVDLKK
jgi:hypothetical protein